jgi:hypothetical protein
MLEVHRRHREEVTLPTLLCLHLLVCDGVEAGAASVM